MAQPAQSQAAPVDERAMKHHSFFHKLYAPAPADGEDICFGTGYKSPKVPIVLQTIPEGRGMRCVIFAHFFNLHRVIVGLSTLVLMCSRCLRVVLFLWIQGKRRRGANFPPESPFNSCRMSVVAERCCRLWTATSPRISRFPNVASYFCVFRLMRRRHQALDVPHRWNGFHDAGNGCGAYPRCSQEPN